MQVLAAEIEEAVFEPHLFGIFGLGEHRKRQFLRRREDFEVLNAHFHLARRHFAVDGFGRARNYGAGHAHHPLRARLVGLGEDRRIRFDHGLRDAEVVAEIEEQEPAVVPAAVHPAREAHARAHVALRERAASVGAIGMHGARTSRKARLCGG